MSSFDDLMETPGEDRIQYLILEIDNHDEALTSSENELYEDLQSAFKRHGTLSPRQVDVLNTFLDRLNSRS